MVDCQIHVLLALNSNWVTYAEFFDWCTTVLFNEKLKIAVLNVYECHQKCHIVLACEAEF